MTYKELNKTLGNIDIYLLDQILKGRYPKRMRILDAGCGEGRNLVYFLNNGFEVYGIDPNPMAIKMLQMMAKNVPKDHFIVCPIEELPFDDAFFDAVICSAVLHFAQDHQHFLQLFDKLYKVLKKNGHLFIRMTTDIGLDLKGNAMGGGTYRLPDGSIRYLITRPMISRLQNDYGFRLLEPVKAVNVDGVRSMLMLMLQKDMA